MERVIHMGQLALRSRLDPMRRGRSELHEPEQHISKFCVISIRQKVHQQLRTTKLLVFCHAFHDLIDQKFTCEV